jgi:endoribonuclease LACTB2
MSGDGDRAELVSPSVWRIPVASPTLPPFDHTNAYLVARERVGLVVDPGGGGRDAVDAVVDAAEAAGVAPKGIVLTHTHPDHVEGVGPLLERWRDARVWVHPVELGRTDPAWNALALDSGRVLTVAGGTVRAVHTPGHSPGHLALWLEEERVLLAGDLVAGAGSIWVGVPDGDVRSYLDSLARAAALAPVVVAPGHGPVRRDGASVFGEARAHRLERQEQLLATLRASPCTLVELRERVYGPLDGVVADLADRSLLAHLREAMRRGRVMHVGSDQSGPYSISPGG